MYATSSGGAVTGFGAGSTSAEAADGDEDKSHLDELKALGIELEWINEAADDEKSTAQSLSMTRSSPLTLSLPHSERRSTGAWSTRLAAG